MDDDTLKHLWALRMVNEALLDGLKLAVFVLENRDDLSKRRRQSIAKTLEGLISEVEYIYKRNPTEH